MRTLPVLLLVAVVGSGLYLVQVSYEARQLFDRLEKAKARQTQLDADAARLEAERQAAATTLRVESTAREKLGMKQARPDTTLYLTVPPVPAMAVSGGGH